MAKHPSLEQLESIDDPTERAIAAGELLAEIAALQANVRELRQAAVTSMHDSGMSWAQVGAALDLHPQRTAQIARGVTGGR